MSTPIIKDMTSWKDWNGYQESSVITVGLFGFLVLTGVILRKRNSLYIRYKSIDELHPKYLKKTHRLRGYGTTVRDGDNFRFYHVPEFKMMYWLMRGKRELKYMSRTKEELKAMRKSGTIAIRLAGIDAPESAHFGMEKQPLSEEATEYLKNLLQTENELNMHLRKVIVEPLKRDQYGRLVSMVYYQPIPFIPWYKNVSEEMLKLGLAVVYTAAGAEYGNIEERLMKLESIAKKRRKGIWGLDNFVSPGKHKELFRAKKEKEDTK